MLTGIVSSFSEKIVKKTNHLNQNRSGLCKFWNAIDFQYYRPCRWIPLFVIFSSQAPNFRGKKSRRLQLSPDVVPRWLILEVTGRIHNKNRGYKVRPQPIAKLQITWIMFGFKVATYINRLIAGQANIVWTQPLEQYDGIEWGWTSNIKQPCNIGLSEHGA